MNRFIFADASKCIGCRTCEVACAVSHQDEDIGTLKDIESFQPRLQMIRNADVTTPVMCRQCDDAPCATVCPNNAILHEDGYVKVIQSRCIGCKTCAVACPYGAMDVVTKMVAEAGAHQTLFKRMVPKSQALKCDLCSHRGNGPACIEVCPTGALTLMDPQELSHSQQKKREIAASSAAAITF